MIFVQIRIMKKHNCAEIKSIFVIIFFRVEFLSVICVTPPTSTKSMPACSDFLKSEKHSVTFFGGMVRQIFMHFIFSASHYTSNKNNHESIYYVF